jgi:hypothetical protein
MRLGSCLLPATIATSLFFLASPLHLHSQSTASGPGVAIDQLLPEAPQPQIAAAEADQLAQQSASAQNQAAPQPAPSAAPVQSTLAQGSSSSQAADPQTDAEKSKHDLAEEQLKAQEHQRVFGVMATFNTTRNKEALPLSPGQKYQLFFKSATDPWAYLLAGAVAGIGQAGSSYPEWGQGTQGYAKKYGAAYSDYFIGNFFGNAVLPSLWHEDPRYFQKGTGSVTSRFLWSATSTVWCKRDSGKWGPNYANVIGNMIGTAIARVYYPASERNVTDTITDGLTVTAEGIVGSEVIEFWPDMVRHYRRKHEEKLARQEAARDAQSAAQAGQKAAPAAKP